MRSSWRSVVPLYCPVPSMPGHEWAHRGVGASVGGPFQRAAPGKLAAYRAPQRWSPCERTRESGSGLERLGEGSDAYQNLEPICRARASRLAEGGTREGQRSVAWGREMRSPGAATASTRRRRRSTSAARSRTLVCAGREARWRPRSAKHVHAWCAERARAGATGGPLGARGTAEQHGLPTWLPHCSFQAPGSVARGGSRRKHAASGRIGRARARRGQLWVPAAVPQHVDVPGRSGDEQSRAS